MERWWSLDNLSTYLAHTWRELCSRPAPKWCFAFLLLVSECMVVRTPVFAEVVQRPGPWDDLHVMFVWLIGPFDRVLLRTLAVFYLADLLLGTLCAIKDGTWRLKRLSMSLIKGGAYFGLLMWAWQLRLTDASGITWGLGLAASKLLEGFLIMTEALSVLRNLDQVLDKYAGSKVPIIRPMLLWLERNLQERLPQVIPTWRILLVEDEASFRHLVTATLARAIKPDHAKTEVFPAETVEVAQELLEGRPFDLILLDLNLRSTQGIRTFESMRAASGNVPIVILTGEEDPMVLERLRTGGADAVLQKKNLTELQLLRNVFLFLNRDRMLRAMGQDFMTAAGKLIPEPATPTTPSGGTNPKTEV